MSITAEERLFDYEVQDAAGRRLGTVTSLWQDNETRALEFIGVDTGHTPGRSHIVPAAGARTDDQSRVVHVAFAEEKIRNAPVFPLDHDLQAHEEERIYDHYGLGRSTDRSASGLAAHEASSGLAEPRGGEREPHVVESGPPHGRDITDDVFREIDEERGRGRDESPRRSPLGSGPPEREEETRIPLAEEQLRVGKREVEGGTVRLRKIVRSEHVSQPVELRRETVEVDRVPVGETDLSTRGPLDRDVGPDAFEEREIEIPTRREEPVVDKTAQVTGEVRARKRTDVETRTVEGDVRREAVEIEDSELDTEHEEALETGTVRREP